MNITIILIIGSSATLIQIKKIVNSIFDQKYKNFELIICDYKNNNIFDEWKATFFSLSDKVKYISSSLNNERIIDKAVNLSSGRYIYFLDENSILENKFSDIMHKKIEEYNYEPDMIILKKNLKNNSENNYIYPSTKLKFGKLYDIHNDKWAMIYAEADLSNKLFLKNFLIKNKTVCKRHPIDVYFIYKLMSYFPKIIFHENNVIKSYKNLSESQIINFFTNWDYIIDFFKKEQKLDEFYPEIEYCYTISHFFTFLKWMDKTTITIKDQIYYLNFAIKQTLMNFPKYQKNLYIISLNHKIYNTLTRFKYSNLSDKEFIQIINKLMKL